MEAVGDPQDERMVQVSLTYEDGEGERQALARNNSDLRSENLALRQEVDRLRAAGDALAAALRRHQMACGVNDASAAVAAWEEARREQ